MGNCIENQYKTPVPQIPQRRPNQRGKAPTVHYKVTPPTVSSNKSYAYDDDTKDMLRTTDFYENSHSKLRYVSY